MIIQHEIELTKLRCYECGRVRFAEPGFTGQCPTCADRIITRLRADADQLQRTISTYKGLLARRKKV